MSSNLKVNTILPSVGNNIGIGTNGGELNVDGGCKVQVGTALTLGHSIGLQYATQNLHSEGFEINQINASGIVTATSFSGSGANLTSLPAGNLTGTLPAISGANLTSLPAQATISNNADNRVITGGSGVNLNGESGLTYDGDNLNLSAGNHDSGMTITAANNNQETKLNVKGKASDGTVHTVSLTAKRSSNRGSIEVGGTERLSITSDGKIGVNQSGPTSELQVGGGTNPMTAKPTFHVAPSSGNASMSLRGGSPSIYFDGTGGGHTRFLTDGTDIAISTGNLDSSGSERFRFRSSGGICFNGDTAAANALDDYEEGSWSPLWSNSASNSGGTTTSNNMYGRYTKIGKMVHAYFYTWGLPSGNSGNMYLQGLPFSCASNPGAFFCAVQSAFYNFGADNYYNLGLRLSTNRTFAELIFCRKDPGNYVPAEFSGFINYYTNFNGVLTYEAA